MVLSLYLGGPSLSLTKLSFGHDPASSGAITPTTTPKEVRARGLRTMVVNHPWITPYFLNSPQFSIMRDARKVLFSKRPAHRISPNQSYEIQKYDLYIPWVSQWCKIILLQNVRWSLYNWNSKQNHNIILPEWKLETTPTKPYWKNVT